MGGLSTGWTDNWSYDGFMLVLCKPVRPISRHTRVGLKSSRLKEDVNGVKLDGKQCERGDEDVVDGSQPDRAACEKSAEQLKYPYYSYVNGQTCTSIGTCKKTVRLRANISNQSALS